jgi:hypothetical protein
MVPNKTEGASLTTTTGKSGTGSSGARRSAGAALLAAAGATCALALTGVSADAAPPDHVKSLHVASLTIVRDRATGTVSGFPNRRKVTINNAPYVADQSGAVHLASARLNGLTRLQLNFFDANGDVETGTAPLKQANTGVSLTSAQLHGAKPNRTKPETMKLSIRPAMFSPPPSRPKATG